MDEIRCFFLLLLLLGARDCVQLDFTSAMLATGAENGEKHRENQFNFPNELDAIKLYREPPHHRHTAQSVGRSVGVSNPAQSFSNKYQFNVSIHVRSAVKRAADCSVL